MAMAYVSGALTKTRDIQNCLKLYESLGRLCENEGLTAFVPHIELDFDPEHHSPEGSQSVFKRESQAILNSELLIACLDDPSTGVGAELQLAINQGLHILAFYQEDVSISRYIRGMLELYPDAKLFEYETSNDLFEWVTHSLREHFRK